MPNVNTNYSARGGTYSEGYAGLAIHGTTKSHMLTANQSVVSFDGIQSVVAAVADITPTALAQQAAGTTCMYLHCVTATGTASQVKGTEVNSAQLAVGNVQLKYPRPAKNTVAIGGYKVVTVGVTFTNGTTDFDASGVTTTFNSFSGRVPTKVF